MNHIRQLRKDKGITQCQLSAAVGVTQATLSYWESGKVSPRLSDLHKLAKVLGCSISDLFEEEAS